MRLLRVQGIVRSFGGAHAVAGVDVAIAAGEFQSIIGPNGAGKTSLFNLLSGHDVPDEGGIVFDGVDIAGWAPERIAGLGLARTFQHGRVFGNLSVRDNILMGAHRRLRAAKPLLPGLGELVVLVLALIRPPSVVSGEKLLNAEVDEVAALFGDRLTPRLENPAYSSSYANRRRVEIARALALCRVLQPRRGRRGRGCRRMSRCGSRRRGGAVGRPARSALEENGSTSATVRRNRQSCSNWSWRDDRWR